MNMKDEELVKLKAEMFSKRKEAEKAAYAYCGACPVGLERERAFEIYENIRNATRI
jgi:hypothetical protein